MVHQQRGELDIARNKYEQLLSALRNTDDLHTLATVYHNLGIVYRDLNRPGDAVLALQSAREIYMDIGSPLDKSDWCLAGVLLATGEFSKALPILSRVRDAFLTQQMPQNAAEVALDIVEALIATNRHVEARALTEQVVKEFVNADLNDDAITAISYLRDLLPGSEEARRAVQHVRLYIKKLRLQPAQLSVPLDEDDK
jgi:tetratricopeptide (TPR) repeat protein